MNESNNKIVVPDSTAIQRKIYTIRNAQVMFDNDLAEFYGVNTKRLNEQVSRNIERFPEEFMFRLSDDEFENWKSQIVTSKQPGLRSQIATSIKKGGRRYLPYVFTEQGVAMLSGVLRSETAVKMSIQIIGAFVAMRKFIINNAQLFQRIDTVEKRQLKHEMEIDEKFEKVFNEMQSNQLEPKQGIFFDGQIFDAHKFVSWLIRKAEKSILLIDNYIDDTVLDLFTKRKKNVAVTILTKKITKELALDLNKFNAQYPAVEIKEFSDSHDRFMIIDNEDVYHIGASLKDLGKKWFAFSKFDKSAFMILKMLNDKKI
ncbi:MAG: ORF6N domain-containing protein [Ignavibacteria bacterium]|nr:ORF6N domain-containing protein [Ignavibacteria bacterium]MDP3830345.1 ORF6N domain-containing protein [Ignavibacteriaceae bacterium]